MADFLAVDRDVYPLGRLDKDSEGLLILTNDKALNALLLHPSQKHKRSYFVQVDGDIQEIALDKIRQGVDIQVDKGTYRTQSCIVKKLSKSPVVPERNPPVRFRMNIPTSWALIELLEGKNRQVRKMFASVGFPVLRLIRVQIEELKIGKLQPGESQKITQTELYRQLNIAMPTTGKKSEPKPKQKKIVAVNKKNEPPKLLKNNALTDKKVNNQSKNAPAPKAKAAKKYKTRRS